MKKFMLLSIFVLLALSVNAQWVVQTSGVTGSLRTVSVIDENVAWISGASGVVLRTTNGGTTWQNVSIAASTATQYIYGIDANTAIVCANPSAGSEVYRTTDAGATWTKVLEQTGGFFNGSIFFNSTNGFLTGDPVGGRWSNFKTTNGGATWDSVGMYLPQVGTEAGWNNSLFVSGSKLYFGTSNSRIYYSTNSGASFTPLTMPLTNSFAIWFTSANRGIAAGSSEGMVGTVDGGTNWTAITTLGSGTIYGLVGYYSTWFHTRGQRLFHSGNDGISWDTAYVAPGTIYHISKARNMTDVVYAVGASGFILKGTGLGLPVELSSFTASAANDRILLNWSTATEVNNRGFEIERSSGGSDFITVGFVKGAGTTTEIQNYSFSDNVPAGIYTYRLKQIDFNGKFEYSQTVEVDFTGGLSYVLDQNYPNPFNPATTISFVTKENSRVSLKVYNVLGDEVATLVNGELTGGVHNVQFDASTLSSGIYFYTLTAGNFTETKKMLLMK